MENPRVYVYQFATGAQWAAGDSVETYLRRLLDVDFIQNLRADRLAALSSFLDEAFQLAHSLGWTGSAREAPQMFSLPGMPVDEEVYMVAWEQEDGVAFIASPFPLPWLDAKASRTTDSGRAVPITNARPAPAAAAPARPQPLEVAPASAREDARDPFSDFIRRDEAPRLTREPGQDEEGGRRFF
ncbi:hypothetical protein [Xanthobacter agilis]|jgi:hypothetical protein|uniref:Uncharacterized protein n=1 Tax=Xanthobacter agilis TaxID=47492 RepID=A0ABU0LEP8_XANAG|nr:hypothetical protein [Xanthobacter agilis]MDQ0505610.1 hypothetical protein [Xanthobacter agilis]